MKILAINPAMAARPTTLCWLLGVALAFFTHELRAQALKFDTSFGNGGSVGTLGTGPGQFVEPSALAFDAVGRIYVSDSENYRVHVFSEDGSFHSAIPLLGSQNQTLGVAVNSQGRVYSSALFTNKSEIQMFNPDGTHYGTFGSFGSGNGQLKTPRGLAIDAQDRVFVPDTENHRIQVFDAEGTFLYKFGSLGAGPGQFNRPFRIALDGQGRIYVPEVGNHRVQVLDAGTGNHLFFIGQGFGSGPGHFNVPTSVSIAQSGDIYVSDAANHRIQIFNHLGNHLAVFGSSGSGTGPGEFAAPGAVAVDALNRVVVANTFNQRIERYFHAPDTYYPLDTDVSDASGNNLHGVPYRDGIAGNPLVHVSGAVNGAAGFDGLNDHVQLPSATLDPTLSFTIATCFQSSKNVDFWQTLVTKAAGPEYNVHDPFLSLGISRSGYAQGRLTFHFSDGDDVHEYETFSNLPVNDGVWHHAAAVYEAGEGKMRLYIDGALNDELGTPGYQGFNAPTDVFVGVGTDGANGIAQPGTFPPAGGPAYLQGLMDELRLFGRALDEAEVVALYENGCGANGAPVLITGNPVVTAPEGSVATNSGTFDDPNPGDLVNLSASIGTVSVSGGAASGTWLWSYPVADGPEDSQTVTITADDGNGGTSMITFALVVENVAPSIQAVSGPAGPIMLGSTATITAQFSDPGIQDSHTCSFSWDDGTLERMFTFDLLS